MGKFNVFVKTAEGASITINDLESCDTVLDLKKKIQAKEGHDPSAIRLIAAGKELTMDDSTMEENEVFKDCTLHMVLRLQGGI